MKAEDERLEHVTSFRAGRNAIDIFGFNRNYCASIFHDPRTGEVISERYVQLNPGQYEELKALASSADEDDASKMRDDVYEIIMIGMEERILRYAALHQLMKIDKL